MLQGIRQQFGLWRSLIIYYGVPFRGRRLVNFYRPFIQPGDLCFDIGAHVGNRLRAWSTLGARVVGLEPQPLLMQFLKRCHGRRENVILLQSAVGASKGQSKMHISRLTPTVSSLSKSWIDDVRRNASFEKVKWDETTSVKMTTLDHLIEQYGRPKVCKIDVEGYELEVLKGLSQPIPLISFEYIPSATELGTQCVKRLSALGLYEFNWSIAENYKFCSTTWLDEVQIIHTLTNTLNHGRSGDIYARQVK